MTLFYTLDNPQPLLLLLDLGAWKNEPNVVQVIKINERKEVQPLPSQVIIVSSAPLGRTIVKTRRVYMSKNIGCNILVVG
jgi:hypothetical protein